MSCSRLVFAASGMLVGMLSFSTSTPVLAAASCPAWTTPVCRQYRCTGGVIGSNCSCVRWACVADRKSDPPKKAQTNERPQPKTRPLKVNRAPLTNQGRRRN